MPQPTRDGYKFAGWKSGRFILTGGVLNMDDTITASWEAIK
ncbi:hypothetical protein DWW20_20290 [Ruminococcus sp. AF14-5]|nr:hypothetical protein DWW20_20290 [Ruminococcus sp. AF14-5]